MAIRRPVVAKMASRALSKYRAVATVVDGRRFASRKEAERYQALRLLQKAGEIEKLQIQVKYPIQVNGEPICQYWADFVYVDCRSGHTVVEDVKGVRTAVYRLKKKLLHAVYGIDIVES